MACKYLDFQDRKKIAKMYQEEARVLDIAYKIGCHPATIYEELRRGDTGKLDKNQRPEYDPRLAQRTFQEAIRRRGNRRTTTTAESGQQTKKEDKDMKMKDLALAQVRRGERFTLDGVEFVKLEDDLDAAFAVAADTLPECCQFEDDDAEREDHNNYAGSLLSKTVERWLRDKHPAIFSAVVERPIDLTTMDGMTDYGKPLAVVRALTIDEYRKHRSILPLTSKPYWLATGWTTNSSPYSNCNSAYCIYADGTVNDYNVGNAYFAPRPALYLKSSILVSVETEDEGKALADYSDTDLIDELYRRRRSTYDPD